MWAQPIETPDAFDARELNGYCTFGGCTCFLVNYEDLFILFNITHYTAFAILNQVV